MQPRKRRVGRSDLATALDMWAASRERAVEVLARRASGLSGAGSLETARQLHHAARHLRLRALEERARAAALRTAAPVDLSFSQHET